MQPQLKKLSVLGHGGFRKLGYTEWGSRHAARTIVCVHGVSRTGRDFDVLAQALVEHEVHLRDALAPFGNLSDAQWRALSLHSAVPDPSGGLRFHFDPAIGARFAIPIWLDIVLWALWDKIECPVLLLRGEDSDLLSSDTVNEMLRRGAAAKAGKVSAIEFPGCGHAPALLDAEQVAAVQKFLFPDRPAARGRAAAPTRLRAGRQAEARAR